jgi:hypothetical protein
MLMPEPVWYQNNGTMDEGIMKTPIPNCRLHWCFCLRWCSSFVDSESESAAEYGLQHNSTHPPPQPNTVCIYHMFTVGKGGEVGEVKE